MKARALLFAPLLASCAGAPKARPEGEPPAARAARPKAPPPAPSAALRAALDNPAREPEERARDVYRHPGETLAFFGLREDMSVVELEPGGGWYTAILAPFLRDKGALAVTVGKYEGWDEAGADRLNKRLRGRFEQNPAAFGRVRTVEVPRDGDYALGEGGSADAVLVFRSIHNWIATGTADKILERAHKALKPGGVLGIEAHRAAPGVKADVKEIEKTGYVPEAEVVRIIENAGFRLDGKSEVNANPKDTKDYPQGVWALPPFFASKDRDRAKYEAIGESDRMTLRFVKP